jgi:PAS domain S-box-containing protein
MATKEELQKRVAELEDQVERLHRFSEVTQEGLVFHEQGKILDVNPALVAIFGYAEASELVGRNVLDFIAPESREAAAQHMQAGHTQPLELLALHKDGTTFSVEGSVRIYEAEGHIIRGVSIRDITVQKQTEDELSRLLNNIRDSVIQTDLEGTIISWNQASERIYGWTAEEAIGQNISLIYKEEDMPILVEQVIKPTMEDGYQEGEYRAVHKDGSEIIERLATSLIRDDAGQPVGMSGIVFDITAEKKAEAERVQLQEEVIEAQKRAIAELSTPVIPIMDRIIVMPLVGSIDSLRAKDITRSLLAGVSQHRAKVVILDVTGVAIMDTGVVNHLNKTIQAARLKGARTIVTGLSDSVAEAIVDLGIDWSGIETLSDLQTGLTAALSSLGVRLSQNGS